MEVHRICMIGGICRAGYGLSYPLQFNIHSQHLHKWFSTISPSASLSKERPGCVGACVETAECYSVSRALVVRRAASIGIR